MKLSRMCKFKYAAYQLDNLENASGNALLHAYLIELNEILCLPTSPRERYIRHKYIYTYAA